LDTRAIGTECEYALLYSPADEQQKACRDSESLLDQLKGLTPFLVSAFKAGDGPIAGEFLGNGGRFYIDRGAHPEYSTPECSSIKEVVAHEKAGDRIVQQLTEAAEELMAEAGRPGRLHVFKNNVDGFGTTYGCHENYLAAPRAIENVGALIPFLVTRQIFCGAGKVSATDRSDAFPYQLTQRADFIDRVFSDRTSQVRGIINLRKREIPKQGQSSRLHILVADSIMSDYALWLRAGATALVLRLLEEDALDDMPVLESPVDAMKNVSRLFDCPLKLENREGQYSALDIQAIYLEKVRRFFDVHQRSAEEEEILTLWEQTLSGLGKLRISSRNWTLEDDPGDMRRRIDWVLKLWLLNRMRQKDGLNWSDYRLRLLDVHYHGLDPQSGIFERCQTLNLTDRIVDEQEILKAQVEPPSDTRAWTRGMIIRYAAGRNVEVVIKNWEKVNILARQTNHLSSHPFDRHRRMVNRLEVKLEDPLAVSDTSVMDQVKDFVAAWD
jgi:proteasome accessory factor A